MTSRIPGVDVGWLESVVPGIEEMADNLPDNFVDNLGDSQIQPRFGQLRGQD